LAVARVANKRARPAASREPIFGGPLIPGSLVSLAPGMTAREKAESLR
jgi:hypothetical protein